MKKFLFIIVFITAGIIFPREAVAIDIGLSGMKKNVKSLKEIRTRNVVTQSLDFSCGPASLATVLSYYFNDKVTEEEIIKFLLLTTNLETVKERKGFSLLDLKKFAQYKGYDVVGYRMDMEYLTALDKPVLIPVSVKDYSHFVIFRGLRGDRVFLADPAMGNMTMRVEQFQGMWQGGIGLVLSKATGEHPNPPLKLSDDEQAVAANPEMVRQFFGTGALGRIYGQGEF